ncbi:hypothetical protein [Actinophytocola sp.]|uniref:hypothetical protein n=1 Tax=Actinophytocola sp. TaxID=1872138 RepID=UPI003899BBAF
MIRKTVNALCAIGAATAVCVAASGAAAADPEALYVNGEPHRADATPNVCYLLHVREGDQLENATGFAVTFYDVSGCRDSSELYTLNHDSSATAPEDATWIMFR